MRLPDCPSIFSSYHSALSGTHLPLLAAWSISGVRWEDGEVQSSLIMLSQNDRRGHMWRANDDLWFPFSHNCCRWLLAKCLSQGLICTVTNKKKCVSYELLTVELLKWRGLLLSSWMICDSGGFLVIKSVYTITCCVLGSESSFLCPLLGLLKRFPDFWRWKRILDDRQHFKLTAIRLPAENVLLYFSVSFFMFLNGAVIFIIIIFLIATRSLGETKQYCILFYCIYFIYNKILNIYNMQIFFPEFICLRYLVASCLEKYPGFTSS